MTTGQLIVTIYFCAFIAGFFWLVIKPRIFPVNKSCTNEILDEWAKVLDIKRNETAEQYRERMLDKLRR